MKLLDALGPNPRLVRMFCAEKGLSIETQAVDLMGGENRSEGFRARNPYGQLPALELDDGTVIAETAVICEYLEERHPSPPLIGTTPEERAEARMWNRRVTLGITEPMSNGFRFGEGLAMFQDRMRTLPDAATGLKEIAHDGQVLLDGLLAGRAWICGDRFTLADITLYTLMDFFAGVGQPRDTELKNLDAWFGRVNERPSAEASLHANAGAVGMRA